MNRVDLTAAAERSLNKLPEGAAAAALEYIAGPLVRGNPMRLGKPLQPPLAGIWSARVGEYRVLYRLTDVVGGAHQLITVVAVRHRRDAYRGA